LDPLERSSEIVFGLIMALTFTCTVSVVASENDVRMMLAAALSCNIAWGLVDGAMYVLAEIVTRQRKRSLVVAISEAPPEEARRLLVENLPGGAEGVFDADHLDRLARGLRDMPPTTGSVTPTWEDLRGAGAIFLLVFLSTFPVALPFLLFSDISVALRTSNVIAISSLFLVGSALGRYMSWPRPWVVGLAVALFGAALVAITIALGG
jgi:VIT1/CCC1 family predicted Fe2+/Mn2+ transporter